VEVTASLAVSFVLDANVPKRAYSPRNRPPIFHPQSTFKAVYGAPVSTRATDEDLEVRRWTDLPAFVASDIFRDLLSQETLDNLLRPTSDDSDRMDAFRKQFGDRVHAEPVLRDRGIHMISANIGRLAPHEDVTKQRLESWKADWERRKVETLAGGDLQAMRVLQRARAGAQHDMVTKLAEIAQSDDSRTAIALRLFQALEAACADPSTRRLLPSDTVEILTGWLGTMGEWFKK
jgi:hypothetical protein